MTKTELITAVNEKVEGVLKKQVKQVIDCLFETMQETLENKDFVRIVGFGTFSVKERDARMGRNPKTGEEMLLPKHFVPVFKPGAELKQAVNK